MASKLDTFLSEHKINDQRLIAASRQIERLRPADRAIKLKQAQARKSEDGKKPEGLEKPRSGRTLTQIGVTRARGADPRISGPYKTRILRAVNRILEQRKKDPVAFDALFDAPAPKAKPAEEASEE